MPLTEPDHFTPSRVVTAPGKVLLVGLGLSLVLHAGLGVWAWNKPFGTMPEVSEATDAVRVRRAASDYVAVSLEGPSMTEAAQAPSAQELSERLLDMRAPELGGDPMELELELRPIEEPFQGMAEGLEIDLPAFVLGDDVLSQLEGAPDELEYGDSIGEGRGTGEGTTQSGSAGLAGNALNSAGAAPRRTPGGGGSLVDRPVLDGPRQGFEELPGVVPDLEALPLDFVELALGDTTDIVVPENLDNDFAYRVTRYQPRDRRGNPTEAGYFRVDITAQRSLRKLETSPKDVIFIIDTSSSVPASWVAEVTRGVRESLVTLNEGDRFNIVLFNDRVSLLSDDGTVEANAANRAAAVEFLAAAESIGYTDVNAAMRQLLVRDVQSERVYELVLISDGQSTRGVTSTRDLINLITRDNDLIAGIYCVGVGPTQNRELLNFLAYRNRGFSVYADRRDQAAQVIGDLMSRLRYPIISNVTLDVASLDANTVFPGDLPNIHQGETFSVFGRYNDADDFTMQISGISGGAPVAFTFTRDIARAGEGDEQIATDWAFWKLHALYSRIIQEGERPELLREVDQLRRRYNLRTLY
ncbi:MAG: VWA domain-containing protein [Phycisphaerales bacterium JB063]